MKALIIILILVVIGYFAYTNLYTPLSDEEKAVKNLKAEFDNAVGEIIRAERMAGTTGIAATFDVNDSVNKIKQVEKELKKLKSSLKEESSIQKAKELEERIKEFYKKSGLD
jgi:pyridoxal biosynthesis lyase PdxS